MTTYYDIPANMLISALADKLSDSKDIVAPDWSEYVKTGVDRERPPTQDNWWTIRAASLLRKVAKQGPIGVTSLAQTYGTVMNNGAGPNTPGVASRHIIRTALQQLDDAGLVEQVYLKTVQLYKKDDHGEWEEDDDGDRIPVKDEKGNLVKQDLYSGRKLTSAGQKLLDEVAHSCRDAANEMYPGLAKY